MVAVAAKAPLRGSAATWITVLALFTVINYNTCIYSDGVPVTLKFADMIGEILTAGPIQNDLPPFSDHY